MTGYEANFNPPLDDRYKCPICLAALRDPVQTKCGHRLCRLCFENIRNGNWYFRCPVDNTWSNCVFDDNAVKREVLSLKIDCANVGKCDWNGELRELQTHLKQCNYERVECPNKCTAEIMRVDYDKHLLECPLRLETCEHCRVQVVVSQLARHHVLVCPKFPVNCPMCGEAEIMRENINSHINIINGDCPMVIVPCSFRHIGCMHQDQRAKMSKHYVEANTHHLMLLSTRLVDLEMKHRLDLEVCAKKFEQIVCDLKNRIDEVEKRNTEMEKDLTSNKELQVLFANSLKEIKTLAQNEYLHFHKRSEQIPPFLLESITQSKDATSSTLCDKLAALVPTTSSSLSPNQSIITTNTALFPSSSLIESLQTQQPNSSNQQLLSKLAHLDTIVTTQVTLPLPVIQPLYEWKIDLNSKRKAHFSDSYLLPNTSYKIHLWLKPETQIDQDIYATVCIILERCDNEEELPVSFDCCFYLTDHSSTTLSPNSNANLMNLFPKQIKSTATTDPFHMSGHVSKPMILFKTSDLYSFAKSETKIIATESETTPTKSITSNIVSIEFCIKAVKENCI